MWYRVSWGTAERCLHGLVAVLPCWLGLERWGRRLYSRIKSQIKRKKKRNKRKAKNKNKHGNGSVTQCDDTMCGVVGSVWWRCGGGCGGPGGGRGGRTARVRLLRYGYGIWHAYKGGASIISICYAYAHTEHTDHI